MKLPVRGSNQNTPSARCPPGRIELRSLSDVLNTLPPLPEIFSSSPIVDTCNRFGEAPTPVVPSRFTDASVMLCTLVPSVRSHHVLPTMPLTDGGAPVSTVECPTAVTVGTAS